MNDRIRKWWGLRTEREQRMLLVLGGLFIVVFVWLAVIRPIDHLLTRARERHDQAVLDLAALTQSKEEIRQLQHQDGPPSNEPVDAVIQASATEAGITLEPTAPDGPNSVNVKVDAVRPQALFGWIGDLERKRGIIADTVTVHANGDATLGAELRLRRRSR